MFWIKVMDFVKNMYDRGKEKDLLSHLSEPLKMHEASIEFPFIVSHPELISIGRGTQILSYARVQPYPELVDKPPLVSIGQNCFMGYRTCILAGADITIGNNVLVASDVTIVSHNHEINPRETIPYIRQGISISPIEIGDNCWIGDKVMILPGVKIGRGCVIGAGAVVTKSIPDYSIAVGNPARVIKQYDFSNEQWSKK